MDDPKAVGRRLREARTRAGRSQRQLSFPGCTPAYISHVESGARTPSLQVLRELGRRLGVSADYLATGSASAAKGTSIVEATVAARLGDLRTGKRMLESAMTDAETNDEILKAQVALGELAFRSGSLDEAIARFEEALDAGAEDTVAVDLLSRSYAKSGRLEDAIALLERAQSAAVAVDNSADVLRFSVLLANALIDAGSFGRAAEVLGASLARSDEWREPLSRAGLYWSQSRLHAVNHRPDLAADYAQKALVLLELTDESGYAGRLYQLLAYIELERNQPREALEMLARGREAAGRLATREDEAKFALEEARAYAQLNDSEMARQRALDALGHLDQLDRQDAARAYAALADTFSRVGDDARAEELFELAIELMEEHGQPYLLETCAAYAQLLKERGQPEVALTVLERGVRAKTRTSSHT